MNGAPRDLRSYAATLAALVDHRWPVTALARIVGEDYASIQGRLADPGARPGLLPVNTVVPDYPEQISWTCGLRGGGRS